MSFGEKECGPWRGVGVGASSQIVPLYLSEVSPPGLRGRACQMLLATS